MVRLMVLVRQVRLVILVSCCVDWEQAVTGVTDYALMPGYK